jgi:signal transduction histidine kinase/CheY-like chemotaxis protein
MDPTGVRTDARTTTMGTAVAVACVAIGVHAIEPAGLVGDVSYLTGLTVAVVIAWAGLARSGSPNASLLVAAGVSVLVAGVVIETSARWTGIGFGAWLAATVYFAGYLLLGAALLGLLTGPGDKRRVVRVDALLEAATIVTVGVLLLWTASTEPAFEARGISVAKGAVQIATPVADLILVVFAARAVVVYRGRSATSWLLATGLTTWLLTSIAFVAAGATPVDRLDLGWLLGMLLVALGTLPRADPVRALGVARAAAPRTHATTRMLLAILPAGVPPIAHLITHRDQHSLYVPYVGMGILLLITLVRMGRLLASEEAARAEVARSRHYFQALADNTVDAIVVVDKRFDIVFCSRSVERYLGEVHQRSLLAWVDSVSPRVREGLEDALRRTLAEPESVLQEELELDLAPDLEPEQVDHLWVLARFVNLLHDPDVRGILISLSDATARKQAELDLERARDAALAGSQAKSTFLATMSHEIRTPLNGVLGLTELMLTTDLDRQQSRYADGIRVAGEALLQVINDVLDFSKIEAGRLELDEVDFDVAQLLDETAGLVAGPAQEKGLELVVSCSPDLPLGLRGDPVRLRQVLLNLAANAVKFTHTGEVLVAARLDHALASEVAAVRFEVVDSGIGVDPAQRQHLFDAFTQADSSTTRKFGGTGLGLAICKQLVTAMGGEIGVDPRSGGGSRFWVSVPLPVAAVQPQPRSARNAGWSRQRVLVVDDSETSRDLLSEQLRRWGLAVDVSSSGLEALTALREAANAGHPYALALLDLSMPDLNGLELASRIGSAPELAGTATLLLTAGTPGLPTASLPSGVAGRLVKPVRPAALHEALEAVLAQRPTPGPHPGIDVSRARILVVEDSEVNQLVAVGILEQLRYHVTVAEDGLAALDALRTGTFDAVLMDCQMPTMDGYQATAEIRRLGLGGPDLPVIAMTAAAVTGDRERCLAAGMNDYISKPVTGAGVAAVLERWLPAPSSPLSPSRVPG